MSQQTHTITLKAVDGVSVVFQKIGQSGQTAATQISTAGRTASAGLAQMDANATKAAASTTKLGTASTGAARGISAINAAARGAAFATFLGFLGDASRAAAEDEAAFVRLETAVDATGASFNESARSIDRHIVVAQRLGFADDAAADAIATMTAQTQSATKAQDNLGLAMDFARGKHISLQTAATVVGKVASGNTAILTRYGIVLDENATSTEALAALQERFSGQAEAFANTQGGAIARVQENLDNFVESIGGALGPMQTWLALLPGISAGMSLAGAAAGGLSKALFGVAEAEVAVATAGGAGGIAAFAAAAAPVLATLGTAAVVAAPAILAVAAASHQAAEAQDEWNRSLANREEFVAANPQSTQAQTDELREIAEAFRTWNTVTTVAIGDTTVGLEELEKRLYDLDTEGVKHVLNFADALGGVTPENIQAIAQEVAAQSETQRITNEARLAEQYELIEAQRAFQAQLNLVPQAATNGQQFLAAYYQQAQDGADAARVAQEEFNISLAKRTLPGAERMTAQAQSFSPGFQAEQDAARLEELARAEEEAARAAQTAISAAQQHAAAMEAEAQAAVTTADALIGTADQRAQSVLRAAEAEEQYAERVSDINSNLSETLGNLQEGYADQTAALAQRRVDIEEQAAERMQSLNEARIDAAKQAEGQLADVAEQRADIVANAAEQAQRAEQAWMQTAGQNLQAQADVRERLQETTADAAQKWHDLNEQNLEQQRAIRVELQTTIADIQRELHASQQEAQRDLQRLAQDHRTAMADFRLDASRIREDLALVINDPRATAAQKNAAELAAQRQLQDLKRQERDEEDSHDRAKEDIRRREREAVADAARQEADAREQARTDYQQLAEERAAAEQAYHEQVSRANEQAADQLQNLADQRAQALAQYQQQQADAHQQTADQLADLQSREQDILEQRAEKYADIEAQRQKLQADTAKQQEALAKQAADAEQQFNESVADAQNAAAEQRIDAQKQYAEATKSDMTELQRLREEGLITEGEYQKIYNDLIEVQETSRDLENEKLLAAIKMVSVQEDLLDLEVAKAKAAREGKKEPDDPLDGPPRRLLGGMARLGTLVGEAGSELAIKGSRMWEVGRSGPEILNLASGTLIMPHGAAQARMRGMALGGHATDSVPQVTTETTRAMRAGSVVNNYGSIVLKVDNADIGSEIARQLSGRNR